MKIGLFLPNWIGDAVMATPTLRAVREQFGPDTRLIGVMRPSVADVLAGTPWLDECLLYDPRSRHASQRSWPLVRTLRRARLDIALLLSNSFRTALLARLAGANERVGYSRYGRRWLLTRPLEPPRSADGTLAPNPMVDYYLALAAAIGCEHTSPRLELQTTSHDEQAADQVCRQFYLREDRIVVFNCSGAFGAAKLWPTEHFAELAKRVAELLDHDVLVVCGPSERALAAEIEQRAHHSRVVSLARQPLSLGLSKACVRRARLMVTTDSGPRHFAVAFGVPVVTIFGPTHPRWVENPTAQATDVRLALDCIGCQRRTCPLSHHRCMRELSVDQVYQHVAAALRQPHKTAA
jgi:heptosyltransferase-2